MSSERGGGGRGPRVTRRTAAAWVAAAVAGGAAAVVAGTVPDPAPPPPPIPPRVAGLPLAPGSVPLGARRPARIASTLAVVPGGRELVWSIRGSGTVRRGPARSQAADAGQGIARLPVVRGADAGVRGLVVTDDGGVFASYVRARDRRLVVAELGQAQPRTVWTGPRARRRRPGGGLTLLPGGRLVVAVGDAGRSPARVRRLGVLGRVVTIDPRGSADQTANRRSRGWHDPTAVAADGRGRIWVADRAGGPDAERSGRADRSDAGVLSVPFRRAPVAAALASGDRRLLACGLLSGRLERTELRGGRVAGQPRILATRCRYGLAIARGRVFVVADDGRITAAGRASKVAATPVGT